MLRVRNLNVYYGNIQALRDISLDIQDGEFVTIIGNNGAGKTTLMMTLSGIVRQASGTIEFQGTSTEKLAPHQILSMGVAHVPQGRMLFPDMTVLENLELGSLRAADNKTLEERLEQVYGHFDILAKRTRQKATDADDCACTDGKSKVAHAGRALFRAGTGHCADDGGDTNESP